MSPLEILPDVTPFRVLIALIVIYIVNFVLSNYRRFQHWKKQGVPELNPWTIHLRTLALLALKGNDISEYFLKQIRQHGTIFGSNEMSRNVLIVAEAESLKDILIRDFTHFMDRTQHVKTKFFSKALTQKEGQEWKQVRSIMSPTFTSGKMKAMFPLMNQCLDSMMKVVEKSNGGDIDVLLMFGNFTMDVIAKCAFAVDTNTHEDLNHPFVVNATNLLTFSMWKIIPFLLMPKWLMEKLDIHFLDDSALTYLRQLGEHLLSERRKIRRDVSSESSSRTYHDFMQLMLEASSDEEPVNGKKTLTDEEIVANAITIFVAGYHTTSVTMSYAAYRLAINPDIQDKARQEVRQAMSNNGGRLDYETLNSLDYLEAVINETLRFYTPATMTERTCSEDYILKVNTPHLERKEIEIPKGTGILVPIYAIHHMEEYYPEPREFQPERFLPENRDQLVQGTFLPFVTGPRNCIGMRFALLELKLGLATILANYNIKKCPKTKVPLEFGPSPLNVKPTDVFVQFEKISF